jgi:hypothetical protein
MVLCPLFKDEQRLSGLPTRFHLALEKADEVLKQIEAQGREA